MKKLFNLLYLSFFLSSLVCAQEFPVIRSSPMAKAALKVEVNYQITCPKRPYVLRYQQQEMRLSLTSNENEVTSTLDLSKSDLAPFFFERGHVGDYFFQCTNANFLMYFTGLQLFKDEIKPVHYQISVNQLGEVNIYKHDYTLKQLNMAFGIKN